MVEHFRKALRAVVAADDTWRNGTMARSSAEYVALEAACRAAGLGTNDARRMLAALDHMEALGTGAYSVADARTGWAEGVRVLTLDEAMALELDPGKAPPFVPVIIAEDGTWHRPMTLLELAALQGLPTRVNGKALQLSGTRTQQATHIGNAVPVGAARAIAERMLVALLEADGAGWSLAGGDTPVWVDGPGVEATC